jgi:hypothetical protein
MYKKIPNSLKNSRERLPFNGKEIKKKKKKEMRRIFSICALA